jgi:hypothetical protein
MIGKSGVAVDFLPPRLISSPFVESVQPVAASIESTIQPASVVARFGLARH